MSFISFPPLPDDPVQLKQEIVSLENKVLSLEDALKEEKASRDLVFKAAENANGFFAKDSAMNKLAIANDEVRNASENVRVYKDRLAEAKAKLERIK
jgi:hypothetical protein